MKSELKKRGYSVNRLGDRWVAYGPIEEIGRFASKKHAEAACREHREDQIAEDAAFNAY